MKTFQQFSLGKNRIHYPPTDKLSQGYIGVIVYEEEYNKLVAETMREAAEIGSDVKLISHGRPCETMDNIQKAILTRADQIEKGDK